MRARSVLTLIGIILAGPGLPGQALAALGLVPAWGPGTEGACVPCGEGGFAAVADEGGLGFYRARRPAAPAATLPEEGRLECGSAGLGRPRDLRAFHRFSDEWLILFLCAAKDGDALLSFSPPSPGEAAVPFRCDDESRAGRISSFRAVRGDFGRAAIVSVKAGRLETLLLGPSPGRQSQRAEAFPADPCAAGRGAPAIVDAFQSNGNYYLIIDGGDGLSLLRLDPAAASPAWEPVSPEGLSGARYAGDLSRGSGASPAFLSAGGSFALEAGAGGWKRLDLQPGMPTAEGNAVRLILPGGWGGENGEEAGALIGVDGEGRAWAASPGGDEPPLPLGAGWTALRGSSGGILCRLEGGLLSILRGPGLVQGIERSLAGEPPEWLIEGDTYFGSSASVPRSGSPQQPGQGLILGAGPPEKAGLLSLSLDANGMVGACALESGGGAELRVREEAAE